MNWSMIKKKKRFVAALNQNQNNTHTHTNIKPSPSTSSSVIQFAVIDVNYVPECSAAPNHKPMCESHWTERGAAWGLVQEGGPSGWTAATLLTLSCSRETPCASPDVLPAANTEKRQTEESGLFHSMWKVICVTFYDTWNALRLDWSTL